MPSERAIVDTLNRKDLLDLIAHFDLRVDDRRVRGNLVDALAKSRQATLPKMLLRLPLASLKALCGKHGLEATGRKATLVERILGASKPANKAAGAQAAKASVKAPPPKKAATKKATKKAPAAKKAATKKAVPAKKAATTKRAIATKATAKKATTKKAASRKTGKAVEVKAAAAPARAGKGAKGAAVSKVAEKAVQAGAKAVRAVAETVRAAAEKLDPGKAAAHASAIPAKAPAAPAAKAPAAPAAKPALQAAKAQGVKASPAVGGAPPATGAATPAAPAAKPTEIGIAAARNVISWGEAVAAVAKRPSAPGAHFIPPGAPDQVRASIQKCAGCNADIHLQKCGVQRCDNLIIVTPSRKICAECLFERNTISMTEFNERLLDEGKCPHCGEAWQRAS